jgi:hypothetical protein
MNETALFFVFNVVLTGILLGMIGYHRYGMRKDRQKTEAIRQDLETEREKTNKFHVSVEEIRRMTKG